jgi:hypothetical protein
MTFLLSIDTLNSPNPPVDVFTSQSFSFDNWAATLAAIAFLIGQTEQ